MKEDFRIGSWSVYPNLNRIAHNGRTIHLEPKAMEVLVCLAEHAGEVVSKEQLIKSVWADTFVTDYVLMRCISDLRKALDDDSRVPRLIETIPKRGYRLIPSIELLGRTHASVQPIPTSIRLPGRKRNRVAIAVLIFVTLVVTTFAVRPRLALHYNNRGVLRQKEGDIKGAIDSYKRALWLRSGYPEAHYNLADSYEEIGNYEKAVQQYEQAIEADPSFYEAYNNLARLYIIRLRDPQSALRLLDRAMDLKPQEKEVQYSLLKNRSWANLQLGLLHQAEQDARQAQAIAPNRGAAHCLLAKVLDASGRANGALKQWELCAAYASQLEMEPEWRNEAQERLRIEVLK